MTDIDVIKRAIRYQRPLAKFIEINHWKDFTELSRPDNFYVVHIYDEHIHVNLIHLRKIRARVLINNDYTSSFAHDMAVSWALGISDSPETLNSLMRYSIKKIISEQLYIAFDCTQSRALFLETLLFDQNVRHEKFIDLSGSELYESLRKSTSSVATNIFSYHEFGHYIILRYPEYFIHLLSEECDSLISFTETIKRNESNSFYEEFCCDIFAVIAILKLNHEDFKTTIRLLAFFYAAYSIMFCAEKTALFTAALWQNQTQEQLDFFDISPVEHKIYDILLDGDEAMIKRARLMIEACEIIAVAHGVELYGRDGGFPLDKGILTTLLLYMRNFFVCHDNNARRSSNLVARALHGHKEGMEYLYRNSKIFFSRANKNLSKWE